MAVGILLITHPGVGSALLAVATQLLRPLPLRVETFDVPFDTEPDALIAGASAALRKVDDGAGVLVLTDLYGASPSNLARRVSQLGTEVHRVSALNLPMLLRVLNYAERDVGELATIAAAGARNGVVVDDA